MRFEEILSRHQRRELSQLEAAEILGMSERTFRRWRDRWRKEGEAGLLDGRVGATRVICNPRGYPGEWGDFDAALVIDIEVEAGPAVEARCGRR